MVRIRGSVVALITPMHRSGEVDLTSLRTLVERQCLAGTQGIAVIGTTGEAPTLTEKEKDAIVTTVLEVTQGRVPVLAGTGTYSTSETIRCTQRAEALGVDACLVVTPYYNRPTQEGLYLHYRAVAEAVNIPLILYNVPRRTGCDLLPETTARLSQIKNIVGIKECASLDRLHALLALCGEGFDIYTGDDDAACEWMLAGAQGVISVTANLVPKRVQAMSRAALSKDPALANRLNQPLQGLNEVLFVEANPIPIKWAAHVLGQAPEGIRLPLTPLSEQHHSRVQQALELSCAAEDEG